MTIRILTILTVCLLLTNCNNYEKGNFILVFENDSCSIIMKEVNKNDFSRFTNSCETTPYLNMRADCISLNELLCLVKDIDKADIVFDYTGLENRYYTVFIEQRIFNTKQDSIIKSKIIDALSVKIEKKSLNIDTTIVTVTDRDKFMKYANMTISDTIVSKFIVSKDSLQFENFEVEKILSRLSAEYENALIFDSEETQRINIKFKKENWESTKEKLQTDLGLDFNIVTTQKEKYFVSRKFEIEN